MITLGEFLFLSLSKTWWELQKLDRKVGPVESALRRAHSIDNAAHESPGYGWELGLDVAIKNSSNDESVRTQVEVLVERTRPNKLMFWKTTQEIHRTLEEDDINHWWMRAKLLAAKKGM